MKPILEKLELLQIFPKSAKPAGPGKPLGSTDLIDRLVRRAEELRSSWTGQESTESRQQTSLHSAEQAALS